MTSETPGAGAPQEEQLREYVDQLRAADPAEIVAQAFTMLGTGAEVKLGRPDARVLIDALGGLVSAVEGRVPQQLMDGMRSGVAQLQQAQVQAEAAPEEPPGDGGEGTAPPPGESQAAGAPPPQAPQAEDQRHTDRLWIPGRDQPPAP